MQNVQDFFRKGTTIPIVLAITAFLSFLAVVGLSANSIFAVPQVDIRTEPQYGIIRTGDIFKITLIVESTIPVNAFEGELSFDSKVLEVESINYNTSIADLWVTDPWYSNGDGSINFAGGTTRTGGFLGTGTLMTVTFKSLREGSGFIGIKHARIMQHDGLGTDAIIKEPIDSIFTIENKKNNAYDVLLKQSTRSTAVVVQKQKLTTDLNGDGKHNLTDLSIFMLHMAQKNSRSDFNQDGKINLSDMSIILNTK